MSTRTLVLLSAGLVILIIGYILFYVVRVSKGIFVGFDLVALVLIVVAIVLSIKQIRAGKRIVS
jgi:hypothetical protein